MKRRNKKLVLAFCLILLAGFALPHFAHAGWLTMELTDVLSMGMKVVIFVISTLFQDLFVFAGSLVQFMLKLNLLVSNTGPGGNAIVGVGWAITRDLANLGFVLAMIVIAFATIVGSESYGYKKLLPKLIAAALLVNFSLTIGGVFIDFSHVVTSFFMSKIVNDSSGNYGNYSAGVAQKLAGAFHIQNYLLGDPNNPLPPNPADEAGVQKLGEAYFTALIEPLVIVMFMLFSVIILFIFAAMLGRRFIELSILLILAPLTWLFWAIPGQSSLFSKWWSRFMNQVFFAPIMMFFVYLALGTAEGLGNLYESSQFFKMGALSNIFTIAARASILEALLIGGLIAAESMGIWGAKFGLSMMAGFGSAAKYMASNSAKSFGQKIAQSKTGQFVSNQVGLRFGPGIKKIGEYKPKSTLGKMAAIVATPVRAPLQAVVSFAGRGLETIGKVPTKPDSIASMGWAAITGGPKGVEGKIGEAKKLKEDKSLSELEKSHTKKLEDKERFKKAGVDEATLRAMDKDIDKLEGEMAKKTELPIDEDGLVKSVKDFRFKRDELLAKSLDTSYYDVQIKKAKTNLDKLRGVEAETSPARKAWEEQIQNLSTERDADVKTGKYIPSPTASHPADAKIEAAEKQVKMWQGLEKQKPKTSVQWHKHAENLEQAHTAAQTQNLPKPVVDHIKNMFDDAKREEKIAEDKEAGKGAKKTSTPTPSGTAPAEEKKNPIITEGFTETTPIATIRAEAAAKSREEERARRAKEADEQNAEGPKIIT